MRTSDYFEIDGSEITHSRGIPLILFQKSSLITRSGILYLLPLIITSSAKTFCSSAVR
jgi:hypothetical protein